MSTRETDEELGAATLGTDRSHARRIADRASVDALRTGDEQAFAALAQRWLDDVNDCVSRAGVADEHAPQVLADVFESARCQVDRLASTDDVSFGAIVMGATIAEVGAAPPPTNGDLTPSRRTLGRLSRGTNPADLAGDPIIGMMLWDAANVLGERVAEIMDLHWRHGLDSGEIAGIVGLERGRIESILAKSPQGLAAALRTRLLWVGGTPEHDQLAHLIAAAGIETFDGQAVRITHRHIRECPACRSRSLIALPAIDLFAAIPLERTAPLRRQAVNAVAGKVAPDLDRPSRETTSETTDETDERTGDEGRDETSGGGDAARSAAEPSDRRLEQREPVANPPGRPGTNPSSAAPPALVAAASAALASSDPAGALEIAPPPAPHPSIATPPPPAEPSATAPATTPAEPRKAARSRSRRPVVAGVAAAVALVLVAALALMRSPGNDTTELDVATAPEPVPSTTRAPSTTATPAEAPPEEEPAAEAEPEPEPAPVLPDPAPAPAPAPAPGLPSGDGGPPTTQALGLQVNFDITSPLGGGRVVRNYEMGQVRLNWSATASRPVTVEVTGPFNGPVNAVRTSTTGNIDLCPGPTSGSTCAAPLGAYYYTIKVFDGGLYVYETTAVLCIALADSPSCN